jgi:hypothetical protein
VTRDQHLFRRALVTLAVAGLAAGLAGCSTTVSLNPAPDANNPTCAGVMTGLTSLAGGTLDGQVRHWTDAQSTAAWGSPSTIIMSCGVTPPGPTTLKCVSLGGIDWIVDPKHSPRLWITTFGRTPAVQVYLDSSAQAGVDPNEVLGTLGRIIGQHTTATAQCSDAATTPSG